ncbi:MAG: hypothetical protein ACMXYG_07130 [Candidatus Woesearchaeota archaeon]
MRSKKSQGISLTTVVIAAIALVVLIILILIFTGRISIFQSATNECPPGSDQMPIGQNCQSSGNYEFIPAGIMRDDQGNTIYCCKQKSDSTGDDDSGVVPEEGNP